MMKFSKQRRGLNPLKQFIHQKQQQFKNLLMLQIKQAIIADAGALIQEQTNLTSRRNVVTKS